MKQTFTLLGLLFIGSLSLNAQSTDQVGLQKKVALALFSSGYSAPLDIQNCGDSRLFIAQRTGVIAVCDSTGRVRKQPFLNIKRKVSGTKGLLGLAFDPNYATNRFLYVYYVNKSNHLTVSRFHVSGSDSNLVDTASERRIITIQPSYLATSHNGGGISFGPDGYLYILTGDGDKTTVNSAQEPGSLLGKMLRISVNPATPYTIPADNPFVGMPGYRPEIWALGLRNGWRWSFDAVTGDLWIADVGEHLWEEINKQPAGSPGGQNYGWKCYEGKHEYDTVGCQPRSNYTFPIYEYQHDTINDPCNAITGGFVYRGQKYNYLYGKYIFADYCSGKMSMLYYVNGKRKVEQVLDGDDYAFTSFGENYKHELFVTNFANGNIYRITVTTSPGSQTDGIAKIRTRLISVAPNPSSGNFAVSYLSQKSQQVKINIQNIMGQQFYTSTKSLIEGTNTWKMNLRLPAGDYYINITDASGKMINERFRIQ